jgi:hypothetical protein
MLVKITDCKDRCACFADAATGLIEHEWKKVVTKTRIPIGGEYTIQRDVTITILRRVSTEKFEIRSYEIAA